MWWIGRGSHLASLWLLLALLAGAGCEGSDDGAGECPGVACPGGEVCLGGLCFEGESDPDGDGLPSALEVAWGFDPLCADSDADGLPDGLEWGLGAEPLDSDGDGVPDGLESQERDNDGDCIPDVWDDDHWEPGIPGAAFVRAMCSDRGVCGSPGANPTVQCAGGVAACAYAPGSGYSLVETSCDGLDNDCDGDVDEGLWWRSASLGTPCWGDGACGLGRVECGGESLSAVCSSMPGGSASQAEAELCDGLDNDCDGVVDNGFWLGEAVLGDACTGIGECLNGTVECSADGLSAICSSMPGGSESMASVELCDGLDNDCDGVPDQDLTPPGVTECPTAGVCGAPGSNPTVECVAGKWVCVFSGVEEYEPGAERSCDGLDNDCDGSVDEEFVLVFGGEVRLIGQSCGSGPCFGGVALCAADGNGLVCSTEANASPEVCDGLDNDCDGKADNGLLYGGKSVGEPCKGTGECGAGVVVCDSATGLAACSSNPPFPGSQAGVEVCDLKDNDCDGLVDEDVGSGPSCTSAGVCSAAAFFADCSGGGWFCDYWQVAKYEWPEVSCDGLDNDCDGRADEGLPATFIGSTVQVNNRWPVDRRGYASFVEQDGGFSVVGGVGTSLQGDEVCFGDWWRYTSDGGWQEYSSEVVTPRHSAAFVSVEGLGGVLVGGRCGETLFSDAWVLTQGAGVQLELPQEVAGRFEHTLLVESEQGDLILVGGRQSDDGEILPSHRCSLAGVCSGPLAGYPMVAGASSCVESLTNTAHIYGGEREDGTVSQTLYRIDMLNDVVIAIELPVGPVARIGAAMLCGTDFVVIHGGYGVDGGLLSDTWLYSLGDGQWLQLSSAGPLLGEALLEERGGTYELWGGLTAEGLLAMPGPLTWDGVGWSAPAVAGPGVGLGGSAAAAAPANWECFGGGIVSSAMGPVARRDVWCRALPGGHWRAAAELPEARVNAVMTYSPQSGRFLILGGESWGGVVDFDYCDGYWVEPESGEKGSWNTCVDGAGPWPAGPGLGVADVWALRLYVVLTGGVETALWSMDFSNSHWSELELPAVVKSGAVSALAWDEVRGELVARVVEGEVARLAWFAPGAQEVARLVELADGKESGPLWLDASADEALLIGSGGSAGAQVIVGQGGLNAGEMAQVPAGLLGDAVVGQWACAWGSGRMRGGNAVGVTLESGLTHFVELGLTMHCK